MSSSEVVVFMKNIIEEAGYEIAEDPDSGWTWRLGGSECEKTMPTMDEAVLDAWVSAASYVNDVLGGNILNNRWESLNIGQQAKLILLCFEDDADEDDDAILTNGLFSVIQENDLLKNTLAALGRHIEVGDSTTAVATWQQVKQEHHIWAI
ncbi:MAG: hypothetical protein B7X93_01445 [Hydrogenophilales bacterium 17-61-9]|nr:MAG: hypothetical protein B7X93_01445 [Hydrogenophilales bacterium 17-61-9]